jgi:hypothetical protein
VLVASNEVVVAIKDVVRSDEVVVVITTLLVVVGGEGKVIPKKCNKSAKSVMMPKRWCLQMSD